MCRQAPLSPEHHHVHGVVSDGGDQSSQGDDQQGGYEQMGAAAGTGAWVSLGQARTYTPALGVELHHPEKRHDQDVIAAAC